AYTQQVSPQYPPEYQIEQPMKWYKFLIYFSLFAAAVLNLSTGIQLLTGAHYQGDAELVYEVFAGLKSVDMMMGIASIAFAVFALYTRFQLSGFRKNGPAVVVAFYAFSAVLNIAYLIGLNSVIPAEVIGQLNTSSFFSSIITSAVLVVANKVYFDKRKHLFVK
ncbi:MAG: hypothetical protein IKW04_01200, partial [Clostridia bacterium]|nr:hypothetical protein [Clostridia bacterium]